MLVMALLCVCSCGDDDSDIGIPNLFGTWYGEKSKKQITVIFREDKTGLFTYESSYWETNHIYYNIEFTYRISGNRIICQGSTNGADIAKIGYLWNLTFVYYDKFLIAVDKDRYDGFYVYKGGIIPEDDPNNGDGNDDSGDNGGSGDGSGDDSSGNGGSSGGSGDDSGGNGGSSGTDGYSSFTLSNSVFNATFSIYSAVKNVNRTYAYTYIVTINIYYPANLFNRDIIGLGIAFKQKDDQGTSTKKLEVDNRIYPCLWYTYSDNKVHNLSYDMLFESNERKITIECLPFYDTSYGRISFDWETITLTPTKIKE